MAGPKTEPLCTCGHEQKDHGTVDGGTECGKAFFIDGRQLLCMCQRYAADLGTVSMKPYWRDLSANSIRLSMAAVIRKDDYREITEKHMHEWKDAEDDDY